MQKRGGGVLFFVRHWEYGMHGDDTIELLPCAVCVQRFGNWMILQLIPLIALYCVLQRNRKPSHPSRHVMWAVIHTRTHPAKNRNAVYFLYKRTFLLLYRRCVITSIGLFLLQILSTKLCCVCGKGLHIYIHRSPRVVYVFFGVIIGKWSSCRFTYSYLVTTFASSIEEISVNFRADKTPPVRSPVLHHHRKQRRAVCTNGRDVIGTVWWAAPTRHSSLRDQ